MTTITFMIKDNDGNIFGTVHNTSPLAEAINDASFLKEKITEITAKVLKDYEEAQEAKSESSPVEFELPFTMTEPFENRADIDSFMKEMRNRFSMKITIIKATRKALQQTVNNFFPHTITLVDPNCEYPIKTSYGCVNLILADGEK